MQNFVAVVVPEKFALGHIEELAGDGSQEMASQLVLGTARVALNSH